MWLARVLGADRLMGLVAWAPLAPLIWGEVGSGGAAGDVGPGGGIEVPDECAGIGCGDQLEGLAGVGSAVGSFKCWEFDADLLSGGYVP